MKYFTGSNERLKMLFESVPRDDLQLLFKRHSKNNLHKLVNEIRRDGSNTLATYIIRLGYCGISYCEIVADVAKKLKIDYKPDDLKSEKDLEFLIVRHLIKKYFDSLSEEERAKLEEQCLALGNKYDEFYKAFFTGSAAVALSLIQGFGTKIFVEILKKIMTRLIVVSSAKVGALNAAKLISLSIPFLNIIFAGWTVIDLAGPAYRKIIPTVFQIGLLRLEYGENPK